MYGQETQAARLEHAVVQGNPVHAPDDVIHDVSHRVYVAAVERAAALLGGRGQGQGRGRGQLVAYRLDDGRVERVARPRRLSSEQTAAPTSCYTRA